MIRSISSHPACCYWYHRHAIVMCLAIIHFSRVSPISPVTLRPPVARVTTMHGMFSDATSFNGDLCSWGPKLLTTTSVDVADMFANSNCAHPGSPMYNPTTEKWGGSFCSSNCLPTVTCFGNNATISGNQELKEAINSYLSGGDGRTAVADNYGNISDWCVDRITDMANIFPYGNTFNGDISSWNGKPYTVVFCCLVLTCCCCEHKE
jgi:hypothetical protein